MKIYNAIRVRYELCIAAALELAYLPRLSPNQAARLDRLLVQIAVDAAALNETYPEVLTRLMVQ